MTGQPRHCDTGMGSFYGMFLYEQIIPKDHFMRALKNLFDWDELGQGLISLYDGKGEQGRRPYNPILIFKMLLLSYLMDLSERDTERWVNENMPARFFLDIAADRAAPDHSTLTTFKKRLLVQKKWEALGGIFDGLLCQMREHGLDFGEIQIVDSVHTCADVNAEKDKARQEQGQAPRDPDATVVHKGKREVVEANGQRVKKEITHRGYKTHSSVAVKTGIVTSIVPDRGRSADNKAFAALLAHDRSLGLPTTTYGGDKAYDDTAIFEQIEVVDMHVGINLRRFRTSKKDANKERWIALQATSEYQEATRLRSRVEQPFGQAKDKHGFERCRYLGLARYGIQSFLTFMVVNLKRAVKLLVNITFRPQAKGRRAEVFEPVYAGLPWA